MTHTEALRALLSAVDMLTYPGEDQPQDPEPWGDWNNGNGDLCGPAMAAAIARARKALAQPATHTEALRQALDAQQAARAARDAMPHGAERSAMNVALDRLDVAIAAVASVQPSAPSAEPAAVACVRGIGYANDLVKYADAAPAAPAPAQAEPVAAMTFNGMSAQEFIGAELFAFQEATGCDTADEFREKQAAPPTAPAPGAPLQAAAVPATDWVDAVMAQAQVFASAWSLVGGRFDFGNGLSDAEEAKAELRAMLASAAVPEPLTEWREAVQRLVTGSTQR